MGLPEPGQHGPGAGATTGPTSYDDSVRASLRPHEPPGFVRFAEFDGRGPIPFEGTSEAEHSENQIGVWWARRQGKANLTFVEDPTAAASPPTVVRTRFPSGLKAGSGPVSFWGWDRARGRQGQKRALYLAMWIMIEGEDYFQNNNGTKMGFFGYGRDSEHSAANEGIIILNGGGKDHFTAGAFGLHFFQGGHIRPVRVLSQNKDERKLMTCGVWHQWEMVLELNDLGVANGTLRMWVDGTEIMNYGNVVYVTRENQNGFYGWKWNPTWGGGKGPRTREDFMRIDHVYMSGIPYSTGG